MTDYATDVVEIITNFLRGKQSHFVKERMHINR